MNRAGRYTVATQHTQSNRFDCTVTIYDVERIPMIMAALVLAVLGVVWHVLWWVALTLFVGGWAWQFLGHAIEGKPPEFLKDWRFLLVGSRWWAAKMRGKA